MRKILVASIVVLALVIAYAPGATAEMAMQGSGPTEFAFHGTFKMLSMGRGLVQLNYEVFGLNTESPPESPFYMATCNCLGSLFAAKGVYEDDSGLCIYVRPNGDKIFATYKAKGQMGGKEATKGKFTIVGGTGKCEGITGGGEYQGLHGYKSGVKDSFYTILKWNVPWRIEAKK